MSSPAVPLLTPLNNQPVAGVEMGNVTLLRLDRTGGLAPGNKHFKLQGWLNAAREQGASRLVSFGGAWSNHLHALAAIGFEQGLATLGLVRGDDAEPDSAMLVDARNWGMEIVRLSRSEYRQRNDAAYLASVRARFDRCLVIPEGGAGAQGAVGCRAIADMLAQHAPSARRVVLPVGTGTTLAGLLDGLDKEAEIIGVSALKGAADLEGRVADALSGDAADRASWCILHDDHCGGFARVSAPLREFMLDFEQVQGVALEPVYTGKMLYAIYRRLRSGEWPSDQPLVAIHTGGLQGRRGFAWLQAAP